MSQLSSFACDTLGQPQTSQARNTRNIRALRIGQCYGCYGCYAFAGLRAWTVERVRQFPTAWMRRSNAGSANGEGDRQ